MSLVLDAIKPPLRILPEEPISVDEFWRLSAENSDLRMELWPNGEITVMSPTKRETGSRNLYIARMLGNWADADGRGEVFDSSTGFELPKGGVLSPDCAWVRFERLRAAERDGKELPLCPDFVIELQSGSDRLKTARAKMLAWMANGSELGWLIDPERKVVEVYRPGEAVEVFEDPTSVQGTGPVRGFELVMGRVWG